MRSKHRAIVDRLISKRLWPYRSSALNRTLFDLWREVGNKVYSFNTRIEGDVKETTQKTRDLTYISKGGGVGGGGVQNSKRLLRVTRVCESKGSIPTALFKCNK